MFLAAQRKQKFGGTSRHTFSSKVTMELGHRASSKLKLAVDNAHLLDARISFVEEGHVYFLDGVPLPLSVTGLINSVASDHFDPVAIIAKMKRGRKWPNPSYADAGPDGSLEPWTDERIAAAWAANGKLAADLGTDLHSKIEEYMNGCQPVFADDTNRVEFGYFLVWWRDALARGFLPYRTEWVIFDADARLAGSIDFVMKNPATNKYYIVDWKRCKTKDAGFARSFGRKFLAPLMHLDEHKANKWAVQVNIYRHMLEKNYGIAIEGMCMVVFHQDNGAAEVHEFPRMPDVAALFSKRSCGDGSGAASCAHI